ncbi:MAG: four helix bundle protein [Saprospiraceae bacterium]|nr:MAG: four helix bundle protein [Saprospiraceae bacterium]
MKTYSFEKMVAWQRAKELNLMIYKVTKDFPKEEIFGLVAQMKRVAISITSNLAEGSARKSDKDKARFYEIAYGSTIEILSQTIVSFELKFLTKENYELVRGLVDDVCFLISQLRKPLVDSVADDEIEYGITKLPPPPNPYDENPN